MVTKMPIAEAIRWKRRDISSDASVERSITYDPGPKYICNRLLFDSPTNSLRPDEWKTKAM